MFFRATFILGAISLGASSLLAANYTLQTVVTGLTRPVKMATAPAENNRLYIVEQPGKIRVIENDKLLPEPALDIKARVYSSANETGLLGLAFHPEYQINGRVFLNYTAGTSGNLHTNISEFRGKNGKIDPNSEQVLLTFSQPFSNHNGGEVAFGPDGYLYISTGDGGSANDPQGNGQNLSTLLGKILRIDVNGKRPYAIPQDNPRFKKQKARPEIYAYGLRNPWRFSFDQKNGDLWVGDVGQNAREEIDIIKKGGNYGWNITEGLLCFKPQNNCVQTGLEKPVFDYPRDQGISVTGGFVYRGKKLPDLVGTYIYGDFGTGYIWGLKTAKGKAVSNKLLIDSGKGVSAFGEDANAELYVVDLDGGIYKVVEETK
jgi:glucose/arabinose dehydrogenase